MSRVLTFTFNDNLEIQEISWAGDKDLPVDDNMQVDGQFIYLVFFLSQKNIDLENLLVVLKKIVHL